MHSLEGLCLILQNTLHFWVLHVFQVQLLLPSVMALKAQYFHMSKPRNSQGNSEIKTTQLMTTSGWKIISNYSCSRELQEFSVRTKFYRATFKDLTVRSIFLYWNPLLRSVQNFLLCSVGGRDKKQQSLSPHNPSSSLEYILPPQSVSSRSCEKKMLSEGIKVQYNAPPWGYRQLFCNSGIS